MWHDENHIGHCTKNDPLFFSFSAFYSTILSEPFPSYLFLHHRTDILFTIISLYMKSLVERIASRTQVCMMSSPKGTKNMYINSAEPQKREEISGKLLYLCPRSKQFFALFPISVYNLIFPFACLTFAYILSHTYFQFIFRSFLLLFARIDGYDAWKTMIFFEGGLKILRKSNGMKYMRWTMDTQHKSWKHAVCKKIDLMHTQKKQMINSVSLMIDSSNKFRDEISRQIYRNCLNLGTILQFT